MPWSFCVLFSSMQLHIVLFVWQHTPFLNKNITIWILILVHLKLFCQLHQCNVKKYILKTFHEQIQILCKSRLISSSRVKIDSKLLFFPVILPVVIIQWTQRMLSYLEAWIMGVVLVVIIVGCISSNINNAMLSKTNLRQQKVVRSPDISYSRFLRALSAHWALVRRTDRA